MNLVHDPENYEKMCEPHSTIDEAKQALSAFMEEVSYLRKRHRIADVSLVAEVCVLGGNTGAKTKRMRTMAHYGSGLLTHEMLLWGVGQSHEATLNDVEKLAELVNNYEKGQAPLPLGDEPEKPKVKTKAEIKAEAERQFAEIEQTFLDVAHWNDAVRKPDEEPIDPDPDGTLAGLRRYLECVVKQCSE